MKPKKLLFLILSLAVITIVVSGCLKTVNNEPEPGEGDNGGDTTTGEIDTSDWLTYRNEEYGFEMKYPEDLQVVSGENIVKFQSDCSQFENNINKQMQCYYEGNFSVELSDKNLEQFIEEYRDDYFEGEPLTKIVSQEDYDLYGFPAKKLQGATAEGSDGLDYIFVVKDNKSYIISFNQSVEIYMKMISTFRFIN
ncbi:MAG: hypothetical protein KKE64_01725 [Candidatus Omnitrophica bacterium]|nr:hypothetical protein [Candidatus Omnitrophota bacterium]